MSDNEARCTITGESLVTAASRQVSTELGDDVLVLCLSSGQYHRLEGVAVAVWRMIREPARVSDIRDAIAARYDVDVERCERDLFELLEGLRERGLVEVRGGREAARDRSVGGRDAS